MATLQQDQFEKIAGWVNEFFVHEGWQAWESALSFSMPIGGGATSAFEIAYYGGKPKLAGGSSHYFLQKFWDDSLVKSGLYAVLLDQDLAVAKDIILTAGALAARLDPLAIGGGQISAKEAAAFLQTKYSFIDAGVASKVYEPWIGKGQSVGGADSVLGKAKAVLDAEASKNKQAPPTPAEVKAIAQSVAGPSFDEIVAIQAPIIPDDYEPDALQAAMIEMTDQLSVELTRIKNGDIKLGPSSVSGEVLIPGTVNPGKLAAGSLGLELAAMPPQEEAILVAVSQDAVRDRWAGPFTYSSVDYTGPGRVWTVKSYTLPEQLSPARPYRRYRLLMKDMKFGVMSCRVLDQYSAGLTITNASQVNADFEVTYGIVLKGLPLLGLKGVQRAILAHPDEPIANALKFQELGNGTWNETTGFKLMQEKLDTAWTSPDPTIYEAFYVAALQSPAGAFGPLQYLNPASTFGGAIESYLRQVSGLSAHVITGIETEDVYMQLSGRESVNGMTLAGGPRAMVATFPVGLDAEAPTTAGSYRLAANAGVSAGVMQPVYHPDSTSAYGGNDILSSTMRVVEGMPFAHEDCTALRRTDGSVSVAIVLEPSRVYPSKAGTGLPWSYPNAAGTGPSTFMGPEFNPATWDQMGLRIVENGHRDVALDLILM